jgi:hypothetical protein
MKRIEGKCLCGTVTVRASPKRPQVEACHCAMCRRWGGSAYLGVQCGSDVEFGGEEAIVRYRSSEWAERGFCGRCGSNLFFRYLPNGNYGLLAGLFDELDGFAFAEEIFIDEKPDYYHFAGTRERMTGAEAMAKFGVGEGGG